MRSQRYETIVILGVVKLGRLPRRLFAQFLKIEIAMEIILQAKHICVGMDV